MSKVPVMPDSSTMGDLCVMGWVKPRQVVVDLGYRGKEVDAANPGVEIIHRGRYKTMGKHERRLLKRRQAVEPAIGHLKADCRMNRCWLKGSMGDALHALSCAVGYNPSHYTQVTHR